MKHISNYLEKKLSRLLLAVSFCMVTLASCEVDNFDGPNASISGAVRDIKDGSLIEQDIENGSKIIYKELGWEVLEEQQMIFKVNGEYRNDLMFAADYDIYFNESNFVKPDTLKAYSVKKGDNTLNFDVQPYIRVSNVSVRQEGENIIASFTITPTVENEVKQVGVFGHIDRIVGNQFALDKKVENVNRSFKDKGETFTLNLSTSRFSKGETYYFRVGALIDEPNAKYNYAPSLQLKIQ